MNRRTYLGACAGGGVLGIAGCLDAVGSRVARTEAVPAIAQWPTAGDLDVNDAGLRYEHRLRPLDEEIDSGNPALGRLEVQGWLAGTQLRATDYNSSRSNTEGIAQDPDDDGDGVDDADEAKANNHNTTRSNRINPVSDEGDGSDEAIDLERAFDYLDDDDDGDGVVVAETFAVSVPVVDLPGVADPAAATGHADYVKNMVTGARRASPTAEETVLRDLTTPTLVSRCCDTATPYIYRSTPQDDDRPMAGTWSGTSLRGETSAPDQSEPVVGRAVATLDGGVTLPVLVWTQHLVHEGDHVFLAGWVVDDARLYGNAATVLTAAGRTNVRAFTTEMEEVGAPVRNAAGEEPCPDDRCGPERVALDAAMDARRADAGPHGDDDWMGLFVVPMDAPLVHDKRIVREVGKKTA